MLELTFYKTHDRSESAYWQKAFAISPEYPIGCHRCGPGYTGVPTEVNRSTPGSIQGASGCSAYPEDDPGVPSGEHRSTLGTPQEVVLTWSISESGPGVPWRYPRKCSAVRVTLGYTGGTPGVLRIIPGIALNRCGSTPGGSPKSLGSFFTPNGNSRTR